MLLKQLNTVELFKISKFRRKFQNKRELKATATPIKTFLDGCTHEQFSLLKSCMAWPACKQRSLPGKDCQIFAVHTRKKLVKENVFVCTGLKWRVFVDPHSQRNTWREERRYMVMYVTVLTKVSLVKTKQKIYILVYKVVC